MKKDKYKALGALLFFLLGTFLFTQFRTLAGSVVQTVIVRNTSPKVTEMSLLDAPEGEYVQDLNLRQGESSTIYLKGYATDPTSCIDIDTPQSWKIVAYRSDLQEKENCIANPENCYPVDVENEMLLSGCISPADTTIEYIAPIRFDYSAVASDWSVFIQITDESEQAKVSRITQFEIESLVAFHVTPAVNYGNLKRGESSSPQEIAFTNLGNTDIAIQYFSLFDFQCSGFFFSDTIPASNVSVTLDTPTGPSLDQSFVLPKKSPSQTGIRSLFLTLHIPESGVKGVCRNVISFKASSLE